MEIIGLATPEVADEIRSLREENDRLRWVVKGAHGALTDAGSVVVPGVLDGDLAPAIRQLTREREEARALVPEDVMFRSQEIAAENERLMAEVKRLTRERDEAREKLARCVEALEVVHWECPGWISVTVPAHDPRCDGTCSAGCPVPVEEQEQCQVCAALAAAKGE